MNAHRTGTTPALSARRTCGGGGSGDLVLHPASNIDKRLHVFYPYPTAWSSSDHNSRNCAIDEPSMPVQALSASPGCSNMSQHKSEKKRRFTMKKILVAVALSIFLVGTGVCFAGPAIPNLVGTWTADTVGAVMVKGDDPATGSMHGGESAAFSENGKIKHIARQAKVVVTAQKGRVLHGTFVSAKATENFVMVIGWDSKTVYLADHDGFMDGTIVNKDRINFVYRHVTPEDTVASAVTWKRSK